MQRNYARRSCRQARPRQPASLIERSASSRQPPQQTPGTAHAARCSMLGATPAAPHAPAADGRSTGPSGRRSSRGLRSSPLGRSRRSARAAVARPLAPPIAVAAANLGTALITTTATSRIGCPRRASAETALQLAPPSQLTGEAAGPTMPGPLLRCTVLAVAMKCCKPQRRSRPENLQETLENLCRIIKISSIF